MSENNTRKKDSRSLPPLKGKIIIKGKIVAVTALHIGGSKDGIDIGGVDLNVIKNHHGEPFIPGSSLKGKLRSMLARLEGTLQAERRPADDENIHTDQDIRYLTNLFGIAANEDGQGEEQLQPTRLIVRDCPLDLENSPNQEKYSEMDFSYTDVKFENSIDRRRGVAQHPRQLERVPAEAKFDFELVMDVYEDDMGPYSAKDGEKLELSTEGPARDQYLKAVCMAMEMLQDDYLGGHGSRGYGKIAFDVEPLIYKELNGLNYGPVALDGELARISEQFVALSTQN